MRAGSREDADENPFHSDAPTQMTFRHFMLHWAAPWQDTLVIGSSPPHKLGGDRVVPNKTLQTKSYKFPPVLKGKSVGKVTGCFITRWDLLPATSHESN